MTAAEPEMPPPARRRSFLSRFDALIFLHCGLLWVLLAGSLALVTARLALGQVEVPRALWAAAWVSIYFLMSLAPVAWFLAGARSSPARSPYNTTHPSKDPILVGGLVSAAFMMLVIDYDKVVALFGVEGCQRERIGSIVRDLGLMGALATCCFVIVSTMTLRQWRMN